MTWRAFILGLLAVIGVGLLDPYTSFNKNYGWNTQGHFPVAAVFLLVVFAVGLNALLKLIRRRSALKQAELMLIWCMLIVGCVVPSNPMRLWFPVMAAPSYLARRPDIPWKDTALEKAPETLLLTKDPRSLAAEQFFEGWRGEGRVPWGQWLRPMSRWAILMAFFYLATFFLCAIIRKQWVDRERLQFPLARIPLEFTEESADKGLLPRLFSNRAFLVGLIGASAFRLVRALPVFFGAESGWNVALPLRDVFQQTPLEHLYLENFQISWMSLCIAYLIPADVSLSVWFFYLFGRAELQVASWCGSTLHYGGTYGVMMRWQRPGAYIVFTIGALFMARRHLLDVARKALARRRTVDDAREPVSYWLSFWGLLICSAGAIVWFRWYGMKVWVGALFFSLLMCIQFVDARVVSQSGLYTTAPLSRGPGLLHALGFGRVFGPTGAVIAHMQYAFMIGGNSTLGPAAIHSFRISEIFDRHRRLLLPALLAALMVAIAASSWTCLYQAYSGSALNFSNVWAVIANPKGAFDLAHQMIQQPTQAVQVRWVPFGLGIVLTGFVMLMRARFYWWPVHSIGLLALSSYSLDRVWFSFMLGWLIKLLFLKFGSGKLLRQGRYFFIAFIVSEVFFTGIATIARAASGGKIPAF